MTDRPALDASVAAVRTAVRRLLTAARAEGHLDGGDLAVAVSGGADSLALAAGAQHVAASAGLRLHGLVVDHGLQAGSAEVARRAAEQLAGLGLHRVRVLPVEVTGPGGPEAAARRARYAALRSALPTPDALVLLGHTRDDQAETVLLGLGRGSGPRSIAGMRPLDPPLARPLLGVSRATTEAACAALGLVPWSDPHNADPTFTRVRLRTEALPLLEDVLNHGVADALARTAAQLREDCDALDALADDLFAEATRGDTLDVAVLAGAPAALRRRALRGWLRGLGVRQLTDAQLRSVDALVGEWRGQGGVWLPGGLVARRAHGRLCVDPTES
ncbi:tRNA lysidine(34) synthetase TilS [Solihabitans fulvus]|uniref:tRNA lysidine(34) synthetase TilS n=1 Tax=Solihabitans fulvus TaxID=1892852 RepID=UPI001CB75CCD|nr:tRNA lysidine(34) synthetase TilS [Solihabitans fulvus]